MISHQCSEQASPNLIGSLSARTTARRDRSRPDAWRGCAPGARHLRSSPRSGASSQEWSPLHAGRRRVWCGRFRGLPRCSVGAEKIACIRSTISRIEASVLGVRPPINSGALGWGPGPIGGAKMAKIALRLPLTKLQKSGLDRDEGGVKIIYDGLIGGASLQRLRGGES